MKHVWAFKYIPCIYESVWGTVSLHKTAQGAYKAMRTDLLEAYKTWYDDRIMYGKGGAEFAYFERWAVVKIEINE